MKNLKVLIFFIFIIGCGSDDQYDPSSKDFVVGSAHGESFFDSRLIPDYNYWTNKFNENGFFSKSETYKLTVVPRYSLEKANKKGTVGECTESQSRNPWNNKVTKYNEIKIDEIELEDPIQLRVSLGHEMTHCWFGLDHVAKAGEIMSANLPTTASFIQNEDVLTEHLLDYIRAAY